MKLLAKTVEDAIRTRRASRAISSAALRRGRANETGRYTARRTRCPRPAHGPERLYGRKLEVEVWSHPSTHRQGRIARAGSGLRLSGIGSPLSSTNCTGARSARPVRVRQVRSVQARHPLCDAHPGVQSLIHSLLGKATPSCRPGAARFLGAGAEWTAHVDLVPELKLIIGDQPPVPELGRSRRKAASSWCSGASSASSPGRTTRWRCFSTTCSGSTRRRSTYSRIC